MGKTHKGIYPVCLLSVAKRFGLTLRFSGRHSAAADRINVRHTFQMVIDELVIQFCEAAIEKGTFAKPTAKDHALHEAMSVVWRRLHEMGTEGQEAFRALLADDSRHVRSWVAAQLLALGDESGVSVLEADAALGGLDGFSSKMVLEEWKAGRLGPPLGNTG